jgi:stage II sporulation protein D
MEAYVVPPPIIRVATHVGAARVSIGADSGVLVRPLQAMAEAPPVQVQRASFLPRAMGVVPAPYFRLQLTSLRDEGAAKAVADRIEHGLKVPAFVRWSEETRTYQVRAGSWLSRDEATAQVPRFRPLGFDRPWVVEEAQPAPAAGGFLQLVETGREMGPVAIAPAKAAEFLSIDGSQYRGSIEVRPDDAGGLTVVNVINLEDYVRGVVPNELSPVVYPQIEALKAQAIAARTYAIRNRGQFAAKGYDICATPACQVYRGKSSEHALTDRAVEETAGLVAWSGGAPINALYTSTCGGHTEDGANIFEGQPEPYLTGVACLPERSAWATLRSTRAPKRTGKEDGLSRDLALLLALRAIEPKLLAPAALETKATDDEVRAWSSRLVAALHRTPCGGTARAANRRGTFFRHVVDTFCWEERAKRLLAPDDPDYLLQLDDRGQLASPEERLAAAILLQEGVISPYEDNTLRPDRGVTRAEALQALARAAQRVGGPALRSGSFKALEGFSLTVSTQGEATETFPLESDLWLFRAFDGARLGTSELTLATGDKVNFVLHDDRVVLLEGEQSRLGAAADRTSRFFRWEVRLTPAEVARAVERYGTVGRVLDVVPKRTGVSGRVVELNVVGSDGELPLRGLKIRWGLGLRENLFVVDRERRKNGDVERFVFTGKGWGHGVGLCQVGAFGMAASGATFEQILQHYYSGITLHKLPS